MLMNGSTAPSETFTSTPINTGGANKRPMAERERARVLPADGPETPCGELLLNDAVVDVVSPMVGCITPNPI